MNFENDLEQVVLCELRPGIILHTYSWTPGGVGDEYYIDIAKGEISKVRVDGAEIVREDNLADVQANPDTFWYDHPNGRLWVNLDGEDPEDHVVMGYVWKGISNRQFPGDDMLDFIPADAWYSTYYEPWLDNESISSLTLSVADQYRSAIEIGIGGISLQNHAGYFYEHLTDYVWNNADIRVLVGKRGDEYVGYDLFYVGRIRSPNVSDESAQFEVSDVRAGAFRSLPIDRYSTDDYADLDENAEDQPVPILFGEKHNITPICIDTTNFIYQVSQTVFGADTYAMEEISAVYFDGVQKTVVTHYTVNLNAGTFTLLVDPGNAHVTCNAKGIKDECDFSDGSFTGNYSENVADHLSFILQVLNEIPVADIDLDSFDALQTARTQAVAFYLNEDIDTIEVVRMLQQTSIFHLLPLADGTYAARYYRRVFPVGSLERRDYNIADFSKWLQSDGVYRNIVIKYNKDPSTEVWQTVSDTELSADYVYREKSQIEIESWLRAEAEAESVLSFYLSLLGIPAQKIEYTDSLEARNQVPTDKVKISRSVETEAGAEIVIDDEEIYAILEVTRNLADGTVGIVAQLDSQLSIYAVHADEPHEDEHTDHSDTLHGDSEHVDHTDDTHTDEAHEDTPHGDQTPEHIDQYYDHTDGVYTDHTDHEDGIHADGVGHVDDHGDTTPPHTDNPYVDEEYVDEYSDSPHEDETHGDHSDTQHVDTHADVTHLDSEV